MAPATSLVPQIFTWFNNYVPCFQAVGAIAQNHPNRLGTTNSWEVIQT